MRGLFSESEPVETQPGLSARSDLSILAVDWVGKLSNAPQAVVPAKAGTHTPCPFDQLRRMGPGSSAGTNRLCRYQNQPLAILFAAALSLFAVTRFVIPVDFCRTVQVTLEKTPGLSCITNPRTIIRNEVNHGRFVFRDTISQSSNISSIVCSYHHSSAPALALVWPSSVTAARSSERSRAASTRRLTKSNAADWRSRGRGRSLPISSNSRPGWRASP